MRATIQKHKTSIFIVFCLIVLALQFFQILYFKREVFFNPYDVPYLVDKVEHSRYFIPGSQRGVGDDELYAYGGYKFFTGVDPTRLVYDKPALGIVFVGFFIFFLHNPAFTGLFFGIGCILLTYLIVNRISKDKRLAIITSTLLLLDPFIAHNFSTSLLDLPQLFFLLANILLLLYLGKRKSHNYILVFLAGVSLGIFAQIKIPVMYPFIILFEIFFCWKLYGKSPLFFFVLGNIFSLAIGYIPYFIHGYSFVEFLKIQKFIISIYKDSKIPLHPDAMWQFLFTGNFPDVVSGIPSKVPEWTLVYPLITISGIFYAVKSFFIKNEHLMVKGLSCIVLVSLLIFTFIPSYPRYIIVILPFLYFLATKIVFSKSLRWGLIAIILAFLYSLTNNFIYYHQPPKAVVSAFYDNFKRQYFQDIYEQSDSKTKEAIKQDEFKKIGQDTFSDAKIRSIEIKEGEYTSSIFDTNVSIPVSITYKTEYLGGFTEKKQIILQKENSVWKVQWDWNYLLNGFEANSKVESERIIGKRGKIVNGDNTVLAEDIHGYLISLNPSLMDSMQESEMLAHLSKLSSVKEVHLQNAYLENPPQNSYVSLFTTNRILKASEKDELMSYKGIKIEEYPSRIYTELDPRTIANTFFEECCTRIYSSHNYHGKDGLERRFDKELSGFDGGSLILRDQDGEVKRVIIQKEKKDGQDIMLQN